MKVEASDYTLKASGRERHGVLLRMTWADGTRGYTDLHTWPELGQPQVHEILRTQAGDIWQQALLASRGDAQARADGRALLRSTRQHRLWMSTWDLSVGRILQARRDGFGSIKLKLDVENLTSEAERLSRLQGWWGDQLRLRLDLNSRGQAGALAHFLDRLPLRIRQLIDYIEDPFAFDAHGWRNFSQRHGVELAWDQPKLATGASTVEALRAAEVAAREQGFVRIWKPLWEPEPPASWRRRVVTSTLGHPIGSLWAAVEAARIAPEEIHGCASHLAYEPLPDFALRMRGDRFAEIERGAYGLGFETSLARLKWREVEPRLRGDSRG